MSYQIPMLCRLNSHTHIRTRTHTHIHIENTAELNARAGHLRRAAPTQFSPSAHTILCVPHARARVPDPNAGAEPLVSLLATTLLAALSSNDTTGLGCRTLTGHRRRRLSTQSYDAMFVTYSLYRCINGLPVCTMYVPYNRVCMPKLSSTPRSMKVNSHGGFNHTQC